MVTGSVVSIFDTVEGGEYELWVTLFRVVVLRNFGDLVLDKVLGLVQGVQNQNLAF